MAIFADYNSYGTTAAPYPYMLNQIHPPVSGNNDFMTMDSIATEFYLLNGTDITFLPREVNKEETTFGEYLSAVFNRGIPLRMYLEEVEAWSGNGDMYSKFGLQVTDECTLYINKSFFNSATTGLYPKQGDLFYVNKSQKLFQISHIEDEVQPAFYLLGNRAGYKFSCKLFAYTHELISQEVSSGIPAAIQAIDSLLQDLNGDMVTLPEKEYNQNNAPIIQSASSIIDTSEEDPLLG
jgi:hypothetical protein